MSNSNKVNGYFSEYQQSTTTGIDWSSYTQAYAPIDEYMSKYRQGYIGYAAAAAYVQDACRSALSSSGILASVSSRAKDAERLKTKLLNMHNEKRFDKANDIEDRIVDIIGVRVLLYFPSQVEEVIAKFESLFPDAILDRKELNDTKSTEGNSMTAPVILEKLGKDDTMKKLGSGPVAVTDTDNGYIHQNRYGGYRAVHIRFTMPTLDLGAEMRSMFTGRLKVEVQIQTLLMHSWSEVSHDLIYKELSGKPSVQEYQLLDCLNGVGKLGENVILQLRSTMDIRLKKGSSGFKSSFILAQYIRENVQGGFGTPVMGDVDDLLDFLNLAQQNDPKRLLAAIEKAKERIVQISPPTGISQIPLVDIILNQMVEKITFTPETPFLLKAQNDQLSKATLNNKNEILATIFDLTCRPILQSVPEKILATNLQFPLAFRKLQELKLYNDNKPAMPRTAFPVHRKELGVSDVKTALGDLVKYFQKRMDNAIVLQYLRHAQIRAWKQFEGRDFSKDFV
ncbi:hypothetical protein AA0113_g708 [Alternaria arborescens]|uniref:RelA/SpoT domain-containing protein n=1 Tax=Alternaria arborescens TaxID=156630 RepID=A0A4Q4SPG2_9PLEO|nr:hypothetical protein AA0111_g10110 [Alternaria arborescens]RYN29783.1 hypothetical protein AA0112_g7083 [Alternaria arborescens]RYO20384.1 hypothetical protein AA0111_g10110 [Alternaria arborescens]RYO72774.1 hypothetical protein AA0113_g708 [Alternaria arborescens]